MKLKRKKIIHKSDTELNFTLFNKKEKGKIITYLSH